MKKIVGLLMLAFFCLHSIAQKPFKKKHIYQTMEKVANWQINHFEEQVTKGSKYKNSHAYWAWTNGAMYLGMLEWATLSNEEKYFRFLKDIGAKEGYKPGPDVYHADDICVSQLYLELFAKYKDSAMIKPTLERMDFILANRKTGDLDFTRKGNQQRWSWCDALFMAPPAYVRAARITDNQQYLAFMDVEFKATYDTLYDIENKLFFRDTRYKTQLEANGKKIFWGRGNGWVVGGLCMMIDNLPANHPSRLFYINLFTEMMTGIVALQDDKGFWHPSLLDAASYPMPETSSSGFFTYGLAWGINHGYLKEKKFKRAAKNGWKALYSVVSPDGKLGWVQPIGADPKSVTADMTEVYGVGAFLKAGSEMYRMK